MKSILTCAAVAALLLAFSPSVLAIDGIAPTNRVRIYWNFGVTEVELYGNQSPLHVANFLGYVERNEYDNTFIHRSVAGSLRFLQGGGFYVPTPVTLAGLMNPASVPSAGLVNNEFDASNGLSNIPRTLAAARQTGINTASSQWFFNVTDNSDGFDPGPYTVFGSVTSGWDAMSATTTAPLFHQRYGTSSSGLVATAPVITTPQGSAVVTLRDIVEVSLLDGDFNLDNRVDAADYALWRDNLGSTTALAIDGSANGVVDSADYAIWRSNFGEFRLLSGDFNADGVVDASDYTVWRDNLGATNQPLIDTDGSGIVDVGDYQIWRANFGSVTQQGALSTAGAGQIPEPTSCLIAAILLIGTIPLSRRQRGA